MSPKGAARHSQATKRGENAAQGCRPALTGNRKGHKRRPRVPPGTHRRQKEPETLPKGVAQGRKAALLGNEQGRERRPRVPPGTHRRRKGARTSPKGATRHSQATKRGKNAAQGCHPALTGDRKGHKRRPRVSPGTHRQRKGAKTLPKGATRHSQATERGINVVQGCRPALTGDRKGRKRRPRAQGSTLRQRI